MRRHILRMALLCAAALLRCSTRAPLNRVDDAQIEALRSSAPVVVVHFWATWCEPCRMEIPELNRLQKKYPGIQFVGVNVDDLENEGAIAPFLKKYPIEFKIVMREGKDFQAMAEALDPEWKGGLPATFVYENGKRIFGKIGMVDAQELDGILSRAAGS